MGVLQRSGGLTRRLAGAAARAAAGAKAAQQQGLPAGAAGSATPFGARGNAGQLNIVKTRMKSVTNVEKITKAMKMVAASKLRQAETKMNTSRGIWQPFMALFGHPFETSVAKTLTVPITSDKGLCGGVNSSIVKYSRGVMALDKQDEDALIIVGEKGKAQLERSDGDKISLLLGDLNKVTITFQQISLIADDILASGKYDKTNIIFNHFVSVISNKQTIATVPSAELALTENKDILDAYEFEDGKEEAMQDLAEFQLAATMWNAVLENTTSENGARMNAMDSSSKNAAEMLDKLTLIYNRGRQASITTELIEIISGATALEG